MNPRALLGIETSCDETAAAVWVEGKILADATTRQTIHELYGGVVPEIASRAHERLLAAAVQQVLGRSGLRPTDLSLVAATHGPGLAGALLVGVSLAKGLSSACRIPYLPINHLEAHLWSAELDEVAVPLPALVLVVSGGHTFLVGVEGLRRYHWLGGTRDDAAGELLDKVGRLLGLGFPAGPGLDATALNFAGRPVRFPSAVLKDGSLDFSFSGLKTAVLYFLRSRFPSRGAEFDLPRPELDAVACGVMNALSHMLCRNLLRAGTAREYRSLVVCGGVAASRFLRQGWQRVADELSIPLIIPSPRYCTDNGAMVAHLASKLAAAGHFDRPDGVDPSAPLPTLPRRTGRGR